MNITLLMLQHLSLHNLKVSFTIEGQLPLTTFYIMRARVCKFIRYKISSVSKQIPGIDSMALHS